MNISDISFLNASKADGIKDLTKRIKKESLIFEIVSFFELRK
jgi:hypothetical protein